VTAGVYLIARTHVLFSLAPPVQFAVAVIGSATILLAGFSALVQNDIKRVLAYSTISQIGYMFLALGIGAWSGALFHFMTHAFFKALLFLAAGVVILAQHNEHDMFRMGGLRTRLPLVFWTFLIGVCSLSAMPFVTAGFYSKDLILWDAWASPLGNSWFWLAGIIGAFVTTVYSFRMLFLVFFGTAKTEITFQPGWRMKIPLLALAVFAALAGFVELPPLVADFTFFSAFLETVLPQLVTAHAPGTERILLLVTEAVQAAGIALAYFFFLRAPQLPDRIVASSAGNMLHGFWLSGWGFDKVYDFLFLRPFLWLARLNRQDAIDSLYAGVARVNVAFHLALSVSQTGGLRWYALGMAAGAIIFLGIVILFGMNG
jgi:NADH-quinone oxidoreductase subunit L